MALFQMGQFTSAAGIKLDWKIECDVLTDADWDGIARIGARILPAFSSVIAVPRGGDKLAKAMSPYICGRGPCLIVDDVWTTGQSMKKMVGISTVIDKDDWIGYVVFSRGGLPTNVRAMWSLNQELRQP